MEGFGMTIEEAAALLTAWRDECVAPYRGLLCDEDIDEIELARHAKEDKNE